MIFFIFVKFTLVLFLQIVIFYIGCNKSVNLSELGSIESLDFDKWSDFCLLQKNLFAGLKEFEKGHLNFTN